MVHGTHLKLILEGCRRAYLPESTYVQKVLPQLHTSWYLPFHFLWSNRLGIICSQTPDLPEWLTLKPHPPKRLSSQWCTSLALSHEKLNPTIGTATQRALVWREVAKVLEAVLSKENDPARELIMLFIVVVGRHSYPANLTRLA